MVSFKALFKIFITFIIYLFRGDMVEARGQLVGLSLPFYFVGSGDCTQVVSLSDKGLSPLGHP